MIEKQPSAKTFTLIAYLLVFVGYMTLTISLHLVGLHSIKLPIDPKGFQFSLSALFLLFSLSAISLSRIADMVGSYRVLTYAQPLSILGLVIVASSINSWMMLLGFCLMGAGTGCYSSIARLLIAKHTPDHHTMRKAFAWFSIILIVAPLASSYLSIYSIHIISWRLGYALMALLECIVLITVAHYLRKTTATKHALNIKEILAGYFYCLRQPYYLLNMLFIGLGVTLMVSILIGYSHQLLAMELHLVEPYFNLAGIGIIAAYIIGILGFRLLPKSISVELVRFSGIVLMIIAACWLYFATSTWSIILAVYLASFALGIITPLSTSAGLTVIKDHHGAAAALYTFSFAVISSLWSFFHAHLTTTTLHFVLISLITITILMLIMCCFTFALARKSQ